MVVGSSYGCRKRMTIGRWSHGIKWRFSLMSWTIKILVIWWWLKWVVVAAAATFLTKRMQDLVGDCNCGDVKRVTGGVVVIKKSGKRVIIMSWLAVISIFVYPL
ncbi:hypothetical protein RND81_09G186500 [Saponaria officinalis]|uniref:Uncharacterized protein n=1 Tax=Saponaria officinalis TaxID=3572 RepID=A0AAW1IPE6_SAPOF